MTIDIPSRNSLPSSQILNRFLGIASRLTGQVPAIDNFGSFNEWNQLNIGSVNVGTVLTLATAIRDYLYIDVEFQGDACKFTTYGSIQNFQFTKAAAGSRYGIYTVRVPYVGPIESILFEQTGYTVRSILVYRASDYSVSETDLSQFTITPLTGWTLTNGVYRATVAPTVLKLVNFGGTLLEGFSGRMGITVVPSAIPNQAPANYTINDGINQGLNVPMLVPSIVWISTVAGGMGFSNNLNANIEVQLTPFVEFFNPVSSTYGADS